MKRRLSAILFAAAMLCCGCSQAPADSTVTETETLPEMTEPPVPAVVYYVTDHDTVSTGSVTSFQSVVEEKGYTFRDGELDALPANADLVVLNAPRTDLTSEEVTQLDSYMAEGGHLMLLMPADETETRYKYLERFLEEYCITMDYDILRETDKNNQLDGDAYHPLIKQISAPDGMTIIPETAERPLYLNRCRSFHFLVKDNFTNIRQDAMLESAETAVGEPCGGVADDPVTYENVMLMTMIYSRDTTKHNAFVVCVGASDFLDDANFSLDTSKSAQDYVFAAIDWAAHPTGF